MSKKTMLISKVIELKDKFSGRSLEWERLTELGQTVDPVILIVYGRRRVGKTELLEQVYRSRNILKFEGIRDKSQAEQMKSVLWQLAEYAKNPLIQKVQVSSWLEIFKLIDDHLPTGAWTLYFEEVQWLADYQDDFISELKFAWDNYFKQRKKLVLILCGSSPSFIINHIIFSKALYNRSQHELHLRPFNLLETREFLQKHQLREVMDTYLTIGGIPEYLKWLGYAFERMCRREHQRIAKILGFHAVHYRSGAFYNRATQIEDPGYQFDLVFDRDDKVITVCEIKYLQNKVGTNAIEAFERKLDYLPERNHKTIHKVLITTVGMDQALEQHHYFDQVITLEEIFKL